MVSKLGDFLRLPYWCILNLAAFQFMSVSVICLTSYEATVKGKNILSFISSPFKDLISSETYSGI